jgi:hypothetical protein
VITGRVGLAVNADREERIFVETSDEMEQAVEAGMYARAENLSETTNTSDVTDRSLGSERVKVTRVSSNT